MKTLIRIQIITVLSLVFLMMNSCTEDFPSMNTKNNLVTDDLVNVDLLFTRVLAYAIVRDASNGNGTIGNYSGMSVSNSNRPFQEGEASGVWNDTYGNYIRNLSSIIQICQKSEDAADLVNKIAMARIMKAWAFARCTDTYGNIPYSESALPIEEAIYHPKYDTQEDIYKDIFKELKEAAAQLDAGKETFGSADLIYGGDVNKWKKLANSLRLRYALRVRYADANLASSNMSDLNESNLITSRADDASIYTVTDYPENRNPLYNSAVSSGSSLTKSFIGKTFLDIMIGNGDAYNPMDPRIKVYADTAMADWPGTTGYEDIANFGYRGHALLGLVPVEEKYPYGAESCSRFSDFVYVAQIERPVIKSSEVYFALAEAALFGIKGTAADAQNYYKKGLEAALAHAKEFHDFSAAQIPDLAELLHPDWSDEDIAQFLAYKELTQDEVDAFLASAPVVTLSGSNEEKLEQIINQKMMVLWPDESEGWFEYRRTGYPRTLVGSDNDHLQGKMPRRMPWPTNEQTINGDQYEAALQVIGGTDNRTVKVWWDANPNPIHQHPGTVETMDHDWIQ